MTYTGGRSDGQEVRARIRHALGGRPDASVRVYGYWAGLIVTVREPQDMPRRPHSMTAVQFQRPLARLKHVGSWGQGRFRQAALAAGFDEGLLVDETGRISEGIITNVGFWRDGMVIWPDAPKLAGITMLLLRRQLTAAGIGQAEEPVRVQDLAGYRRDDLVQLARLGAGQPGRRPGGSPGRGIHRRHRGRNRQLPMGRDLAACRPPSRSCCSCAAGRTADGT